MVQVRTRAGGWLAVAGRNPDVARFDVTDAEWALIEPFLPVAATGPLPRRVRDGFRRDPAGDSAPGAGWRDVPERYGPWSTVCSRFSGWARPGCSRG